jgi:predicted glycoside hydrolase/deacetylase ChbG (UPF0249 family)
MKLIINADDFGMTKYVNEAIIELCKLGVTTSTTVMVNMPFWKEITDLLPLKHVSIGLHVNLTEGLPVTDPKLIPSLLNSKGFFHNPKELKNLAKSGKINKDQLMIELKNQFQMLYDLIGERIDHFDSHQGTNKIKLVTDCLSEIVKDNKHKMGIRVYQKYYIRNINSRLVVTHPHLKNIIEFGLKRVAVEFVLRYRTRKIEKVFFHPDGLLLTKVHRGLDVFKILPKLDEQACPGKILEIAFHPATSTIGLPTEMSESRLNEYKYLKSDEFREAIKRFELINYTMIKS